MRRLLAVLGQDVSASLSPVLHSAAARACDLDVAYVPISCPDEAHFVRAIEALGIVGALGCNVTIPYKHAAKQIADALSPAAAAIGAVNTLTFGARGVRGDNTDGPGLLAVLQGLPDAAFDRVQILGAGGAARAAIWAVARRGAKQSIVCARRETQAEAAAAVGGAGWGVLEPVEGATLVISSLPAAAVVEALGAVDIAAGPRVLDLAYSGADGSALVHRAREQGLDATDGLDMLVEQAALALAGWTGGEVSSIRQAMRDALAT